METTLQTVSYANPKARARLKPILIKWFQNPKELHLTEPKMTYPFRFQKWVQLSLPGPDSPTYLLTQGKKVLAHLSCQYEREHNRGLLFHLFVDPRYRHRGHARNLMTAVELDAQQRGIKTLWLRLISQNTVAQTLVLQLGYALNSKTKGGLLKMYKELM